MDGGYVALEVPGQLKRAVHRFAYGDDGVGIGPEPFVDGDVHGLDRALGVQEVVLRLRCGRSDGERNSDSVDHNAEEHQHTEVDTYHNIAGVPQVHRQDRRREGYENDVPLEFDTGAGRADERYQIGRQYPGDEVQDETH